MLSHFMLKTKDNRKHHLNQIDPALAECMHKYLVEQREYAGPPTPESMRKDVETYLMLSVPPTADFLREYLEKYQEKVFVVKNKADRERLLELLTKR